MTRKATVSRETKLNTYTAKYTKISRGYMGQLAEWLEVVTEGKTLEECREMLQDALGEMIIAYRQQNKEVPVEYWLPPNSKRSLGIPHAPMQSGHYKG